MGTSLKNDFVLLAKKASTYNAFENTYGLSRSILALGTLITLLFTKWSLLFPVEFCTKYPINTIFDKFNLFVVAGYVHLNLILSFCCITLIAVIIGYGGKITGILHFWITFSFFRYCPIVDGGDQITQILTLCLIPITLLDKRKNHWEKNKYSYSPYINITVYCIVKFIQLQMALLYFHAGIDKLRVDEWLNGTDIYYWFTHNVFGLPSWCRTWVTPLLYNSFIVSSLTWGTIILEILLFACFFMTEKRKATFFKIAIMFHFGIVVVHGLVSFFFAMAGGLILYLLPLNNHIDFKKKINVFSRKPKVAL